MRRPVDDTDRECARKINMLIDKLNAAREAHGLLAFRREDLAKTLQITQGLLSRYLSGNAVIGYKVLLKFSDFLGVNPADLKEDALLKGKKNNITLKEISEEEVEILRDYNYLTPNQRVIVASQINAYKTANLEVLAHKSLSNRV
jgi:transcriptional regulator with XRE-family HTH domain